MIFLGIVCSFINCVDVEYESKREEEFYDIQVFFKYLHVISFIYSFILFSFIYSTFVYNILMFFIIYFIYLLIYLSINSCVYFLFIHFSTNMNPITSLISFNEVIIDLCHQIVIYSVLQFLSFSPIFMII